MVAIIRSTGNDDCHCIHRGGKTGPNYEEKFIKQSASVLQKKGVCDRIMVDCSHGNSGKDYRRQPNVASVVAEQVSKGSNNIMGVMIESNIKEGKQKLDVSQEGGKKVKLTYDQILANLEYGKSVTDSCVNLVTTRKMLQELSGAVQERRRIRKSESESK
jgi:3-deoxy-7-phosphoheptulonate synthase